MSTKQRINYQYINILIVFLIGCSLIFLNQYTNSKLKELELSSKEAIMLSDGLLVTDKEELTKYLKKYRPESYKGIEIYDENFNSVFSLMLDNSHPRMNIQDYPKLILELQSTEEGQTTFESNGYETNIYFKWNNNSNNEKLLYVIYSKRSIVKYLWLFNFICGGIMCLILILLIINHFVIYKLNVKYYSIINDELEKKIKYNN